MKLYELANNYLSVLEMLDNDINTDKQVLQDTLESINDAFEVKIENCAKLILSMDAEIKKFDSEVKRLSDKKKALQNKLKYLKDYVLDSMMKSDKSKIKTAVGNVRVQKNSQMGVSVLDESKIPLEYFITPAPTLSKAAILDAFKDGEVVPGVDINLGYHLRIQ